MASFPADRWLVAGVDESPHGATVARVALVLGRRLSLRVMLVHAVGGLNARTELVGERRLDRIDAGRSVLEAVTEQVEGADELTARLVLGGAAEELAKLAGQTDVELVVVGSRGFGPLRAGLAGSVSRRLCRTSDVPVVVVPTGVDAPWDPGARSSAEPAAA